MAHIKRRKTTSGDWRYDVSVHNRGVPDEDIVNDEAVETCTGPSDFEFFVSIRFPLPP